MRICSSDGREIARGIVNYNAEELHRIRGRHTSEFSEILGAKLYDEVIHRDNMTLMI